MLNCKLYLSRWPKNVRKTVALCRSLFNMHHIYLLACIHHAVNFSWPISLFDINERETVSRGIFSLGVSSAAGIRLIPCGCVKRGGMCCSADRFKALWFCWSLGWWMVTADSSYRCISWWCEPFNFWHYSLNTLCGTCEHISNRSTNMLPPLLPFCLATSSA